MHVTALAIYPIKGCRGRVVTSASLDPIGFVDDRRLMLVDATGRFLSQREVPALATIQPDIDGPMLQVQVAGRAPLSLELDPRGAPREVRIWGSTLTATDQGDAAASWFSAVIGQPCRLVHFGAHARRPLDPAFTPRDDAETAFTDGYPVLGVLEESLEDLNRRLPAPIPMARFRPNLVLRGAPAWSEDDWRELAIGPLVFDAVKPCARCVVTTTDQGSGARDPDQEPLRTLSAFRLQRPFGAIFGQNLVARAPGRVAVGDAVALR